MSSKVTAYDVQQLLKDHHKGDEWAYFEEVRNATGHVAQARYADGLAVGLWPSRGLHIYGYEIKVARQDWLKELKTPEKAESIAAYCDFWVVVAPPDVVKLEEVPANWGFMSVKDGKLRTSKQPVQNDAAKPLTRAFLASLARQVHKSIGQEAIKKLREELDTHYRTVHESDAKFHKSKYETMVRAVTEFEKVSGITLLGSLSPLVHPNVDKFSNIGAVVRKVMAQESQVDGVEMRLRRLQKQAEEIHKSITLLLDPPEQQSGV